ncbi:MAG: hypothetical protein C0410_13030 [Anaerolinea sp.]|nr:hypothetical protein [Anaerolinea sp.]
MVMPDFTGQSTGRYHILEPLGRGGMAVVYKAYDTSLDIDIAIKFIRTERLSPELAEKSLKRFKTEAQKTARLTHPNIIPVTDYGDFNGIPFLVMRYIEGGKTLKSLLGKPIPWKEAVKIILPIADALSYAHKNQIIHRDVKPANILITQYGIPMLSDFGIAKVIEENETMDGLTTAGMAIGTPEYMAPEQWEGKKIDGRADIYALGVVLYELITGRPPFKADTVPATMVQVLRDPLPRPKQFCPDLPNLVEKVLFKALAKNPENRFSDMESFIAAMQAVLENSQISFAAINSAEDQDLTTRDENPIMDIYETVDLPPVLPVADQSKVPVNLPVLEKPNGKNRNWVFWTGGLLVLIVIVVFAISRIGNNKPESTPEMVPTQPDATATTNEIVTNTLEPTSTQKIVTQAPKMLVPASHMVTNCGVDSFLNKGDLTFVSLGGGSNGIRSEADTAPSDNKIGTAESGEMMFIIGGPECDRGGYLLWNVVPTFNADWNSGWTPEIAKPVGEYWLSPLPYWKPCGGSSISHLKIGDRAYVSTVNDTSNNLRESPGTSSKDIGGVEPGKFVTILDGPQCKDDLIWWYVKDEKNKTGWTAEGLGGKFWLIPYLR